MNSGFQYNSQVKKIKSTRQIAKRGTKLKMYTYILLQNTCLKKKFILEINVLYIIILIKKLKYKN